MLRVVEDLSADKYGPAFRGKDGAIAVRGPSPYRHRFGGSSWRVIDDSPLAGGPTLLLTFDLADPLFKRYLRVPRLDEIPICSYLTCDAWVYPQLYKLDPANHEVMLIQRGDPATEARAPEFSAPLEEISIALQAMSEADCPTSEDSYWVACDRFVGGDRFIRVLGPILWMYAVSRVECECGELMDYFCSIGYEKSSISVPLIPGSRLFFGEAALYWFVCPQCLTVAVISQDV